MVFLLLNNTYSNLIHYVSRPYFLKNVVLLHKYLLFSPSFYRKCLFCVRLHPPAPSVMRKAIHDDVICGYEIPAGTKLTLHQGALMR